MAEHALEAAQAFGDMPGGTCGPVRIRGRRQRRIRGGLAGLEADHPDELAVVGGGEAGDAGVAHDRDTASGFIRCTAGAISAAERVEGVLSTVLVSHFVGDEVDVFGAGVAAAIVVRVAVDLPESRHLQPAAQLHRLIGIQLDPRPPGRGAPCPRRHA